MLTVKRLNTFEEARVPWSHLESQTEHFPFQELWYLEIFCKHFCSVDTVYLLEVLDGEKILAVGAFERIGENILLLGMKQVLGGQDLTDYGDILLSSDLGQYSVGDIWESLINYFKMESIASLRLDFIREDSKTFTEFQKKMQKDNRIELLPQEVSPYIMLPLSWDDYLKSLSRDERHELKRKIKRFESLDAFHDCTDDTLEEDFNDFIRLHRMSDVKKEKFMSEDMKRFFWDIVVAKKEVYSVHFCFLSADSKKVASIMYFVGQQRILLYNSGFDTNYAYFSLGLILHAHLIKESIQKKYTVHDFLRGSERYKYDLGAKNMQLFKISIVIQD